MGLSSHHSWCTAFIAALTFQVCGSVFVGGGHTSASSHGADPALLPNATEYRFIYTHDWLGARPLQFEPYLARFVGQPIKALEVGSFQGMGTVWFLQKVLTHPLSAITCVDNFAGGPVGYDALSLKDMYQIFRHNTAPYRSQVTVLRGDSQEMLRTLEPTPTYELIYIDADHRASSVLEDAVLSFPTLKVGGVLIFDDYGWPFGEHPYDRPGIAVDAFMAIYQPYVRVLYIGYTVVLEKIANTRLAASASGG